MNKLFTLNCPKCGRKQSGATPNKELFFQTAFNCEPCGWHGTAKEGKVIEMSKEEWNKASWEN